MESTHISRKIHITIYLFSILLFLASLGLLGYEFNQIERIREELDVTDKNLEASGIKIEELGKKLASMPSVKTEKVESAQENPEDMIPEHTMPEYITQLKGELQEKIENLQNDGSQWSVYFCDLKGGKDFTLNNNKMQAASLIKLFIMGCVYEDYEMMTLKDTKEQIDEWLKLMITISDNDAANQLVYVLGDGDEAKGRDKVNRFAEEHGYTATHMGRLLLASNDLDDNYTSVADCGKFLWNCYENKLSYSNDMQELLKQQSRRQKIPAGIPDDVIVGNKTGELQDVHNDVAIVYIEESPYLLCVMSQELKNSDEAINQIAELSGIVYSSVKDVDVKN